MQVHQLSPSMTQQHFSSPPPSMISPVNLYAGDEGGRLSHSPNQLNAHACSHNHCSASFPTIDLLEKHEIINHSSGASSVVCTSLYFMEKIIINYFTSLCSPFLPFNK